MWFMMPVEMNHFQIDGTDIEPVQPGLLEDTPLAFNLVEINITKIKQKRACAVNSMLLQVSLLI